MARFNTPTKSNTFTKTTTREGGAGYKADNPTIELLFTAACTYVGEDTFYETAEQRTARIVQLVHDGVKRNPRAVATVARQLRKDFQIRTASILVACEYVAAGGPNGRSVIDSVCQRADEPGEVLAYWLSTHGRKIPRGIKMGLGDACRRLYTPRNVIKYDTPSHSVRFADVIELCHVHPETTVDGKTINKSDLFKFLLDQRHNDAGDPTNIEMLQKHAWLASQEADVRRGLLTDLGPDALAEAGFTWERLSSWLPGGMDAAAWEAVIPSMGVMALVRNLRNFDQANISARAVDAVIAKITDSDEVEKSRIFPYQVLLAYQHAPSDNWKRALGTTVDLASSNLPRLDRSLLVVDTSRSMRNLLSLKSMADRITVAGLQAASIARHSRSCNIVIFGDTNVDITNDVRGRSVLGAAEHIYGLVGSVGCSTFGHTAIRDNFDPDRHDRAILFTDDQQHDSMDRSERERSLSYMYSPTRRGWDVTPADISHVPQVVTFNVSGEEIRSTYGKGRIVVAGFSDAIFNSVAKILQLETSEPVGTTV